MEEIKKVRGFEIVQDKFRKNKEAIITLPRRATMFSSCYDFCLPCDVIMPPHSTAMVYSDVKAYMQNDEALLLYVRSSVGRKGVTLTNGTGVIDSDYYNNENNDGNIAFLLKNNNNYSVAFHKGDNVVQGMFVNYLITDNDSKGRYRYGGMGSTDFDYENYDPNDLSDEEEDYNDD